MEPGGTQLFHSGKVSVSKQLKSFNDYAVVWQRCLYSVAYLKALLGDRLAGNVEIYSIF